MAERKPGIDPALLPMWKDHELEAAMKKSHENATYHEERAAFWKADAAAIYFELRKRENAKRFRP